MLDLSNVVMSTDTKHIPYLREAYQHGWDDSEDPNTKTGALIKNNEGLILIKGYNHFVPNIEDVAERHIAPDKYDYIKHAESHCIEQAAANGIKISGLTMYTPWFPCIPCAKHIEGSGIITIVGHLQHNLMTPQDWEKDLNRAIFILNRAKIQMIMYDGHIGDVKGYFRKQEWNP